MKKKPITRVLSLAVLLACLVGVIGLSACSSPEPAAPVEPEEEVPVDPDYTVQLFVDCEKNAMFSKYDVNVLVDGELVGNIEHGSEATFELSLKKGQHELVFEQDETSEPDGRTSFVVEGDGDKFAYRIGCTSDQIEIESIDEEDSDDQLSATSETTKEDDSSKKEATSGEDKGESADKQTGSKPAKFEYAFKRHEKDYDSYYLFDFNNMAVTYFTTLKANTMILPITGDFKSGLQINFPEEGFHQYIKLKNPGSDEAIIITDDNGSEWEYIKTDVGEAEAILAGLG